MNCNFSDPLNFMDVKLTCSATSPGLYSSNLIILLTLIWVGFLEVCLEVRRGVITPTLLSKNCSNYARNLKFVSTHICSFRK